jgi:hypothetical protein
MQAPGHCYHDRHEVVPGLLLDFGPIDSLLR